MVADLDLAAVEARAKRARALFDPAAVADHPERAAWLLAVNDVPALLVETRRLQSELEAAQRKVLERDEDLAMTRPPGWDSTGDLYTAYVNALDFVERYEPVAAAAGAWYAAFGANPVPYQEFERRCDALRAAVESVPAQPFPAEGVAALVSRLRAELAEATEANDTVWRLAEARAADHVRVSQELEQQRAAVDRLTRHAGWLAEQWHAGNVTRAALLAEIARLRAKLAARKEPDQP